MTARIFKTAVIGLTVAGCSLVPCQGAETVTSLLERMRDATGHAELRRWPHGLHLRGVGEASGLETRFDFQLLADGRFRMELDSPLGSVKGFDGNRGWQIDYTGMPYPLECWELEVKSLAAWMIGGRWLDADSPLKLALLPEDGDSATARLLARIPGGALEGTLHIATRTFLPRMLTWQVYDTVSVLELGDYRKVAGFSFPHRVKISEDGDVVEIRFEEIRAADETSYEACEAPTTLPPDTSYRKGTSAAVEMALTGDGLLVRPKVNGRDDAWFILDSGAGCNVIDKGYARKLRMDLFGKGKAIGVGGTVDIKYRKGEVIALGPVEISNPIFVELRLGYGKGSDGRRIGGILGFDFFSRSVVEIDNEAEAVRIHDRGAFDGDGVHWQEILFCEDTPAVTCDMSGGHRGVFSIDTGSPGSVAFNRSFVLEKGLLEGMELSEMRMAGVGGGVRGYEGHIDWIELGGRRIERPRAVFARSDEGVFSNRMTAGLIGRELLSGFKAIIFDYPGGRVGFRY